MKEILYLNEYIVSGVHETTITVFGAGGTGSHLLYHLARVDFALKSMGRKGIHVRLYDSGTVRETTPARALFPINNLYEGKAIALISSINCTYGTKWKANEQGSGIDNSDFFITCTDTVASRREIYQTIKDKGMGKYFIDCGNGKDSGQIVLWTNRNAKKGYLQSVFQRFPKIRDEEITNSCSVFESISAQGLFVNSLMGQLCANMIFEFLLNYNLDYCGYFMNMENGWAKIPVKLFGVKKN